MTPARPSNSWLFERFDHAARMVGDHPGPKLVKLLQKVFSEQLVVVLPSYVSGPYEQRYEDFWQRMVSGKSLAYGEAIEWSKMILILRDILELECYLAPKEQPSEAEGKRRKPRKVYRRAGGQNTPSA